MVYSTTGIMAIEKHNDGYLFVKKQLTAILIGLLVMLISWRSDARILEKYPTLFFFIALFLAILPMIPGIGTSAGGAKRWINMPGFRLQPVEFAKVFFLIFLAGYVNNNRQHLKKFWIGLAKPILCVTIIAIPILAEPDFGSAAVLILITLTVLAVSGADLKYLFFAGILVAIGLCLLIIISPYRLQRVLSFLSPLSDPSGRGYQLIQSLIAISSGDLFGKGLGESQQKLFFLPAAHTDFIFAVIVEELGFFGGIAIIALYLLFLWRGIAVASALAEFPFLMVIALSMTLLITMPALLNIGVVLGMLPTKGLVLPLLGYGGSNALASLAAVGLLLAASKIARERKPPSKISQQRLNNLSLPIASTDLK